MLTDRTLDRLLDIEVGRHEAVIAVDDRGIAGVARYARDETDPTTAAVAILVADEWQHHGVARGLMRPLMARAARCGHQTVSSRDPPGEQHRETLLHRSRADNPRTNGGRNAVITVDLDDALAGP